MMPDEDTQSVCSQVEEVIRCAICWECPQQPKVLPCQHSFCLRCIHPAYLSNIEQHIHPSDRVQCPLCRNYHAVPKQGLPALPNDHKVNALTDIVRKKRYVKSKKFCSVCSVSRRFTTATNYCLSCGALLCSECCACHQENELYQKHIQVMLFQMDADCLHCREHSKQLVLSYCLDCEQTLCKACMHGAHASHRLSEFVSVDGADGSVAESVYAYLTKKRAELLPQQQKITSLCADNTSKQQQVDKQLSQVQQQIKELQEKERQLLEMTEYHETLQTHLHDLENQVNKAESQFTSAIQILQEAIHPLSSYHDITVNDVPLQSVHNVFSQIEIVTSEIDAIAEEFIKKNEDSDYKPTHLGDWQNVETIFKDLKEEIINKGKKLLWASDIQAYDVQFLPDDSKNVICTGQKLKWKLHMLNFQGERVAMPPYLEEFLCCDCRIVTNPITASIGVTHRVQEDGLCLPYSTIHIDDKCKTSSIQTSREQVQLCSLAVTRSGNMAFTFMDHYDPPRSTTIRCHDMKRQSEWCQITSPGTSQGELKSPYYIIVDQLDRFIVSDHLGEKVSIYDSKGQYLLSFPKSHINSKDQGQFHGGQDAKSVCLQPSGICTDSDGNIMVAFPTQRVISLFTPNGQFMHHIIRTQGEPRGISLWADRYLAVGFFTRGVAMYDLKAVDDETSGDEESSGETTEVHDDRDIEA